MQTAMHDACAGTSTEAAENLRFVPQLSNANENQIYDFNFLFLSCSCRYIYRLS